jgi:hypothetical protein
VWVNMARPTASRFEHHRSSRCQGSGSARAHTAGGATSHRFVCNWALICRGVLAKRTGKHDPERKET